MGFILPSYTSSHSACPVSTIQISTTNGVLISPSDLNNPVLVSTSQIVKPIDTSLHQAYQVFFTLVTTSGGSVGWFGSYTLNVGCFSGSVTFSDGGSF